MTARRKKKLRQGEYGERVQWRKRNRSPHAGKDEESVSQRGTGNAIRKKG